MTVAKLIRTLAGLSPDAEELLLPEYADVDESDVIRDVCAYGNWTHDTGVYDSLGARESGAHEVWYPGSPEAPGEG
jgi:hypothetical protein